MRIYKFFFNENLQEYKETATFLMVPISFVAKLIALQLALCLFPHGQKAQGKERRTPESWQQVQCVLKHFT